MVRRVPGTPGRCASPPQESCCSQRSPSARPRPRRAGHPLRDPGRRLARSRAGDARRPARRARAARRRPRPLQPALERGRGGARASPTGPSPTRCSKGCAPAGIPAVVASSARRRGPTAAWRRASRRAAPPTWRRSPAPLPTRYGWVRDWLIWNEPNQRRWLRPASPALYVARILNPAYAAIHGVNPACPGRRRRHGAARRIGRRLAGGLDPRHAPRRREARRLRPPPVSGPAVRLAVRRRARVPALRGDHDGAGRAAGAARSHAPGARASGSG